MAKLVGHVDADSYYVSAERVRYPWLVGVPAGVLGNQGACVIARSYEMKAYGIKVGEPIWEAKRKCPEGLYLKRDFRWYEALGRRMLAVVETFSPVREFYSIDESFFEVEPGEDPGRLAVRLRDTIKAQVGVPVTVGIARSRTLAKLISDSAKPFGARAVVGRDAERELLAGLPVQDVTGIAGRRAATLACHGIRTCLEFADAKRTLVKQLLTKTGEALWYELNGEPVVPIQTERKPHKMLSRGGSMSGRVTNPNVLDAWLVRNTERLIEELRWHEVLAGKLDVWVSYADDRPTLGGHAPLETSTDRFDLLLYAARQAIKEALQPGWQATHMHLVAGSLQSPGLRQCGLFDPPDEPERTVADLKEAVNRRHGRFALRSAATLPLKSVYADGANDYDICDVRGKSCF